MTNGDLSSARVHGEALAQFRLTGEFPSEQRGAMAVDETMVDVLLRSRWYVVRNDEIGGWAITNVDKPTSALVPCKGEYIALEATSERLAEYVVNLHNRSCELSL